MTGGMGLRERKRLAAMRRIQEVALDLFDQHGYPQVTIERIAAEADFSPSTVYRYFGAKERLILWDEDDPAAIVRLSEEVRNHPPLEAARRTVAAGFRDIAARGDFQRNLRRVRYAMEEPAVEAAAAVLSYQMAELFAQAIAEGLERDHVDLHIRLFCHGIIGALLGGIRHWYQHGFQFPLEEIIDQIFIEFEEGFAFG